MNALSSCFTVFNVSAIAQKSVILIACTILIFGLAIVQVAGQAQVEVGWPRQILKDGDKIVYYQPQIDEWDNFEELRCQMAFALTPKGGSEIHGVASLSCQTLVDKEEHTAYLKKIEITSVRFPTLDSDKSGKMEALFRKIFPTSGESISVDRVMADLEAKQAAVPTVALKNDPPPIFYSKSPAILLIVQGEPILSDISKIKTEFLVNANWDVFYDKSGKEYYLLTEDTWLKSKALQGPWEITMTLPKDMAKLPAGENFDDVKTRIPPKESSGAPQVFFSDKPAELIAIKGLPVYSTIEGTNLLYISNTENDVFLDKSSKTYFVLFSGRWFSALELSGPWAYAGNDLAKDFLKIPEKSEKAHVLASVPGTREAADAVLLAQIPTSAIITKAEAEAKVKVGYDGGKASFKPIDGTEMQYATNTQEKVIKYSSSYYLCFQAVWFVSNSPDGPWKVASVVPQVIYTIPPSSPVYNVVYVKQTEESETTVRSDVAAGYFGAFIITVGIAACIAYGTGWYYPPYIYKGLGMLYPFYRPFPCTYGAGYVYNPWTGGFAGGRRVYGPYGTAGTSAWFNPATGRYGRAASVQGFYGGRTAAHSYNPWTGRYASTNQGHNPYAQWGSSVVSRGGNWAQTGHITNATGTTAAYRTSTGQHGVVHVGPNGTFAGHDGNVYRKENTGNWNRYNNGTWHQASNVDAKTRQELDRSSSARQRGQTQTLKFQSGKRTRHSTGRSGLRRR